MVGTSTVGTVRERQVGELRELLLPHLRYAGIPVTLRELEFLKNGQWRRRSFETDTYQRDCDGADEGEEFLSDQTSAIFGQWVPLEAYPGEVQEGGELLGTWGLTRFGSWISVQVWVMPTASDSGPIQHVTRVRLRHTTVRHLLESGFTVTDIADGLAAGLRAWYQRRKADWERAGTIASDFDLQRVVVLAQT